jgi:hypothetical protein
MLYDMQCADTVEPPLVDTCQVDTSLRTQNLSPKMVISIQVKLCYSEIRTAVLSPKDVLIREVLLNMFGRNPSKHEMRPMKFTKHRCAKSCHILIHFTTLDNLSKLYQTSRILNIPLTYVWTIWEWRNFVNFLGLSAWRQL